MEHITNSSEEVISDLKTTKGTTAKKKCKKAKDTNQNVDKTNCNNLEIDEIIMDNLSIHTNNGLPNGVAKEHNSKMEHENENIDTNKENQCVNNSCDRLDSETEALVERISTVDINETTTQGSVTITSCEQVSEDCKTNSSETKCLECNDGNCSSSDDIVFESYKSELQMGEIMRLIQKDLSEPYSIYTYRYFIHNWPKLCFLAMHEKRCIGAIVCKLDLHRKVKRGYIAMLAVDEKYRKRKIGSHLVRQAITAMVADDADEVVLETEITNKPALRLYGNLGFVRDKRLFRYYLNGVDALRLKLWLR